MHFFHSGHVASSAASISCLSTAVEKPDPAAVMWSSVISQRPLRVERYVYRHLDFCSAS